MIFSLMVIRLVSRSTKINQTESLYQGTYTVLGKTNTIHGSDKTEMYKVVERFRVVQCSVKTSAGNVH